MKASGGASGHLLKKTESYVRSVAPMASLTPAIWAALTSDSASAGQRVLTRHALLKTAFIFNGSIHKSHCSSLMSSESEDAEKAMVRLREITEEVSGDRRVQFFIEGADCRIIAQILGLKDVPNSQFSSLDGLMRQMLEELASEIGIAIDMKEFASATVKSTAKSSDKDKKTSSERKLSTLNMYCCQLSTRVSIVGSTLSSKVNTTHECKHDQAIVGAPSNQQVRNPTKVR